MKGGAHILAYEITVFLGSIPFVTFLTWRALDLGLSKRNAFFITVFLCGDVMLFPWALRLGWIDWWIVSIMVLFISSILWPKVLVNKTKNNVLATEINVNGENNSTEQIQVNTVETVETVNLVNTESLVCMDEFYRLMPIEELINLGFKEKDSKNFEQAASYFSYALSQDPTPDLAFSLILDCYWLWSNLGERDYALTQLKNYAQKYLPLFNTALRVQFDAWMVQQDLQIILEE